MYYPSFKIYFRYLGQLLTVQQSNIERTHAVGVILVLRIFEDIIIISFYTIEVFIYHVYDGNQKNVHYI